MTPPNILSLIQSLTPTEKQHFKKSYLHQNDFVKLFDYINKYQNVETNKICAFLNKDRKAKKVNKKEYSSGHISVLKSYLQEKIMESLRTQYIPRRNSLEMIIRSVNADILLEKGLYQLAKKEIQTAKKKSIDNSFPIEKLMLYRRESIIQFYEDYRNSTIEEITDLYENRIEAAEQLLLEIKYARILTILSFQYFKNEKDMEMVQSFIEEDYMQDFSLAKEFGTQYLFHWVHAQFAEFKNQPEEAIASFEKTIRVWLDYPEYIQAHPRMYLGTCSTYLKYILQQKKPSSLILKEGDLELLLSKINSLKLPTDVSFKMEQLFLIAQLFNFRSNHRYPSIIKLFPSIQKTMNTLFPTNDFTKIIIQYFAAVAFFQQGDYKKSHDLLYNLIFTPTLDLKVNPEYDIHVFRLSLMAQFELKNFKFLKFELNNIKQQLMENQRLDAFEEQFFKMISQLTSVRYLGKEDLVYQRFHTRLNKIMEQEQWEHQLEYQLVMNWIEKK